MLKLKIVDFTKEYGCIPDSVNESYEGASDLAKLTGILEESYWIIVNRVLMCANKEKSKDCFQSDRQYGIRPCVDYDDIKKLGVIYKTGRNIEETLLKYGEYPQSIEHDRKIISILSSKYLMNKLNKTGKKYTFDTSVFYQHKNGKMIPQKDFSGPFEASTFDEYEYDGKKYIRFRMNENCMNNYYIKYKKNKIVWVRVEPIIWRKIGDYAITVNTLLAGVRFNYSITSNDKLDYNNSILNNYFKKYMCYEILPQEDYSIKKSEIEKNDLEKIIDEIKNIIRKYEEVIHEPEYIKLKETINQNLDCLIDEYNRQIDEYINKIDGNTFGLKSPDILELELKVKLESYLDELNSFILPIGSYYKMIDILSLNENKDNSNDDLLQDLKQIKDVILPYLGNEHVVLEYEKFIENEIENLKARSNNREILDLKTLKIEFRKKLNNYLLKFAVSINNISYITKLIKNTNEDSSLEKRKTSANLYEALLKEIIRTSNYIDVNGNADERKNSQDIMEFFHFIINNSDIAIATEDFISSLKVTLQKLEYIKFDISLRTHAEIELGSKRIRKIK